MASPILSITIPTFNRAARLSATLATVMPQLKSGVELLVSDNCSPDGTWQYLASLPQTVRRFRQERNIGSERNMLDCVAKSRGDYIWLLCDDDIVAENVVEQILRAISEYQRPPLIYLRTQGRPACPPIKGRDPYWIQESAEEFISDISHWITFCSSIVVRRDCIDTEFLKRQIGTYLLPAALTLSVAGVYRRIIVSSQQVLFVQAGERGAYDAVGIFSRNLRSLLRESVRLSWLPQSSAKHLYEDNLRHVVGSYLRSDWPLRPFSAAAMVLWSMDCRVLYTNLLPHLLRRVIRSTTAALRTRLEGT